MSIFASRLVFTLTRICILLMLTVSVQAADVTDRLGRRVLDDGGNHLVYNDADRPDNTASKYSHQVSPVLNSDPDITEHVNWVWATLGTGIGVGLLDSADLDGDGDLEVITTGGGESFGGPNAIFILENNLTDVTCMLEQAGAPLDYHIQQLDSDKPLEVLLVTSTEILMIDGASCVIESRSIFPSPIDSGGLGDINHDGIPDVAYSVGNDLYLAPWNDFSNPLERRGFGGSRIIVEPLGRVDGDDIGVASNVLFVLRGDSLQTIMEIADPISPMFDFGDIDGNGEAEVIVGVPWSDGITVYGVPGGEVLLNVPFFNLATLRAQDFDGDGNSEIVFGEAQWGSVGIIDGDGTLLKSISNPSHGTTNVLVVDLHADNKQELLWGAGHTDTGSDHLYSGDLQSELVSWWSQDIDGPFQLAQPGKYLASSRSQVAVSFAESDSSYDIGGVATLEMLNGRQIDQFLAIDGSGWGTITTVAAANVDEDQAWEICFSGDYLYDEFISCRDAISGETEWSRQIASGYIYQILLEDIDIDGQKELLTINAWGIVSSYDASSGNLEWVSEDLTADFISWGFDGMAMVNGDLWVVFPTGNIRKLDPLSGDLVEAADGTPVTHVATNGGTVYACRNGEGVGVLNPETLAFESVLYPTTGNLSLLTLADDGKTLLTASGSRPDFAPVLISVSAAFDPVLLGQMRFWDEHLTGYQHLLLTTSNGVMSISFQWLDVIFKSGFE